MYTTLSLLRRTTNATALPRKDPRAQLSARAKPKARKTKTLTHGIIAGTVCPFYRSSLASPTNPTACGYCWPDIARVTTASASGLSTQAERVKI